MSKLSQIEECVAAAANTSFTSDELAAIDMHATESGINLWAKSSGSWLKGGVVAGKILRPGSELLRPSWGAREITVTPARASCFLT